MTEIWDCPCRHDRLLSAVFHRQKNRFALPGTHQRRPVPCRQKNTILAIWMAQLFTCPLFPPSAQVPMSYGKTSSIPGNSGNREKTKKPVWLIPIRKKPDAWLFGQWILRLFPGIFLSHLFILDQIRFPHMGPFSEFISGTSAIKENGQYHFQCGQPAKPYKEGIDYTLQSAHGPGR